MRRLSSGRESVIVRGERPGEGVVEMDEKTT